MTATAQTRLQPGFDDPVLESQSVFRALLDAMARPGQPQDIAQESVLTLEVPAPLRPVAAAICLTLLDVDTALWLDAPARASEDLRRFLVFHCGCPLTEDPAAAAFALITDPLAMPPLGAFGQGTAEYPDRSTTLVIQVEALGEAGGETLGEEGGAVLRGPGIEHSRRFRAAPLPPDFWAQAQANRALFPRGVDLVFAAPERLAALPRSSRLEIV